jgi:hypothetical protein
MVGTSHGYDHSALDPWTGNFYHRPFNSREVFRYNTITRTWTALPPIPDDVWDTVSCCVGMDYYSAVDGVVLASAASHGAIVWDERDQDWKALTGPLAMGAYHNFAEVNPNRHTLVFGGGNAPGSRSLYWLDADGFAAPLRDAPFDLGIQWGAVFTSDPVSGAYLVLARSGELWSYDVSFETWRLLFETTPVTTTSYDNPIHGVVATPISSYGVTLFVTCEREDCRVTLYKHVGD